jgi:hypothetical protein
MRQIILIIALALAGCQTAAAPTESVKPTAGTAALTITRSTDILYVGAPASVTVNGESVANLSVGETYSGALRPGTVTIAVSAWSAPGEFKMKFRADPGKSYRLHISPRGESYAASVVGGLPGMAIEGGGPFKIVAAN